MKKQLVAMVLTSVMLVLTACGGSSSGTPSGNTQTPVATQPAAQAEVSETEPEPEPLDLTGNWEDKDASQKESIHAGYINGNRIEIFWVMDGGESTALYWSGTYDAPTGATDSYTWDSVNDKTRTDRAMLASGDDTKTFTYENGELSYQASAMGTTATIHLIPTEKDYMSLSAGSGEDVVAAGDLKEVELVNSGYAVHQSGSYNYIMYAVEIANPNESHAIEFPKIQVTARDVEDKILKNEEMTLMGIAAGDSYTYGSYVSYEGDLPDKVEISVSNDSNNYISQASSDIMYSDDLVVSNTSETGGMFKSFTGEVTNNSTEDLSAVAITVVYMKDGQIVGGDTGYVDDVRSGSTKVFEISSYSSFEDYDSYMVYALQW